MTQHQQVHCQINNNYNNQQQIKQSVKCKSSKIPTHFTIPQQNQNHKMKVKNNTLKQKQKTSTKTVQDKQFRKLNKQTKKVKSLEEDYRQLEEQLKDIKDMIKLQLQIIEHQHTTSESTMSYNSEPLSKNITQGPTTKNSHPNLSSLQKLIQTLFSYQQTISASNSNYLLLSQVTKEQQSQTLFHINNLQDRIKQLRFLLNGKEDLLAYQVATFDQSDNMVQENEQQVVIDYHLPKKMALANYNAVEGEYQLVEKALGEMVQLKEVIVRLEEELGVRKSFVDNVSEQTVTQNNQTIKNHSKDGSQTLRTTNNMISSNQHKKTQPSKQFQNIITASTQRGQQKSIIKNSQNLDSPTPTPTPNQLTFLPMSTSNYKTSLIYKVGKLHQAEQQRQQHLKSTYQQLVLQYQKEMQSKTKLIQDYQLKKDIYTYKKKSSASHSNNLLIQIKESQQENISETDVNVENILHELHQAEVQQNKKIIEKEKGIAKQLIQTTQINLKPKQQPIQTQSSCTIQENDSFSLQKGKEKQAIFVEITNTPKKKFTNPFLKLKTTNKKPFSSTQANIDKKPTDSIFYTQKTDKENCQLKSQQLNNANKVTIMQREPAIENGQLRCKTPSRGRRQLTQRKVKQNRSHEKVQFQQVCN